MAVTQNKAVTSQALRTGQATAIAAKITYGDLANAVKVFTAGPNGSIVYSLKALPRVTVTACQLQAYRSPDGVAANFFDAVLMNPYTMAPTTAPTKTDFGYGETAPLRLKALEEIWVGTGVAFAGGVVFDCTAEDL